jgi:hypothetical protein
MPVQETTDLVLAIQDLAGARVRPEQRLDDPLQLVRGLRHLRRATHCDKLVATEAEAAQLGRLSALFPDEPELLIEIFCAHSEATGSVSLSRQILSGVGGSSTGAQAFAALFCLASQPEIVSFDELVQLSEDALELNSDWRNVMGPLLSEARMLAESYQSILTGSDRNSQMRTLINYAIHTCTAVDIGQPCPSEWYLPSRYWARRQMKNMASEDSEFVTGLLVAVRSELAGSPSVAGLDDLAYWMPDSVSSSYRASVR